VDNHGYIELKDLYHDRVKIPDRLKEQIRRNNIMEMRIQTMANVVPIFVALVSNMLHHNNVGVTYPRTSNLRMEPIKYVPLYFVAMP
jgi:hypothetical protein